MPLALLLSVRFHDGRYHGRPEWPPSSARLFQALVAGAARGEALSAEDRDALAWLEQLQPPVIVAPAARIGSGFRNYVPNNDLDAVGGDPRRVAEIRAPKFIRPFLFDAGKSLLYAWTFDADEDQARKLCAIAERLYQLGRGVDMAWAWAEIVDASELDARLADHGGVVYRPGAGEGEDMTLPSPQKGSLDSLERRFAGTGQRFSAVKSGRQRRTLFSQAPRPSFASVPYGGVCRLLLFDMQQAEETGEPRLAAWPLVQASKLVESLRDKAAERLKRALPEKEALVDRVFIGRDAAKEADKAARIRIVPLPSIGSPHVVRSIRRVLVELSVNCPLSADDVAWAFSGLDLGIDYRTGEVLHENQPVLVLAGDRGMLRHYGCDGGFRMWRTVTPAALSEKAARRRIDPRRLGEELVASHSGAGAQFKEAKPSGERLDEERRAAAAVAQALRHAGVSARVEAIRVQREPFEGRGARAEIFAGGTRFAKERLWHAEVAFGEPLRGPLVIGDGRYLGLGVMAPQRDALRDAVVFAVPAEAAIPLADGPGLVHATRRALMALERDVGGGMSKLFSGHEDDGGRAASGRHEHVFLAADDGDGDGRIDRLIVAAPWVCDHSLRPDRRMRTKFDEVASRLETVRAGRLGVILLGRPASFEGRDALIGPAQVWESRTPYQATRHAGRRKDPRAALARDVTAECERRGLPRPEVEIVEFSPVPDGGGLRARARLRFAAAIQGPLLLGRDSHRGGGLFAVGG